MNILLSGGWGYGNLGDDAILYATLRLLSQRFPNATIKIFSYDAESTSKELKGKYEVYNSIHRCLFGDRAFKQLSVYKKSSDYRFRHPFIGRVINRLKRELNRFFTKEEPPIDLRKLVETEKLFEWADIFVMSGGGYLNNWRDSLVSRIEELRLAQKYKLKNYIIGQTLDDFEQGYIDRLKTLFSKVSGISVRDEMSKAVLLKMGINSILSPDLVLSRLTHLGLNVHRQNELVFIPAELPLSSRKHLIDIISEFVKKNNLKLRIAVTRLYNADIVHAEWCVKQFRNNNIDAQFRIPKSFMDIYRDIVGVQYVISRNLHGLILGYIGGANVQSLNNGWKFHGFMKQINREDSMIDIDNLSDAEISGIKGKIYDNKLAEELKHQVENNFYKMFD